MKMIFKKMYIYKRSRPQGKIGIWRKNVYVL